MKNRFRQQIRRPWRPEQKPPASPLAMLLSGLNVAEALEAGAPRYLYRYLHYGPALFSAENWAGLLVWFREQGYYSYQELQLFGVWAVRQDEQVHLLVGERHLHYTAPVYNPESYHHVIRQSFKPYYNDSGQPPQGASIFYQADYDPARRLALRQEISDAIRAGFRRIQR
jgi:hypothetical protein